MLAASADNATPHWIDDHAALIPYFKRQQRVHEHELAEGRSLLQLFFAVPSYQNVAGPGSVIDFKGLEERGFNLLGVALESAVSRFVKPLECRTLTTGAKLPERKAAKRFNRLVDGILDANKFPQLAARIVGDGALAGHGYGLWEDDGQGNLCAERLNPLATWISDNATTCVTRRTMSRRKARARFGKTAELREAINKQSAHREEHIEGVDSSTSDWANDNIAIYCAWSLELSDDEPGFEVLQLADGTELVDQGYDLTVLPVFPFIWAHGFREEDAKPLGRVIAPFHYWHTKLLHKLAKQLQASNPIVVRDDKTTVSVTDMPMQQIEVPQGSTPVQVYVPETVSGHIREFLPELRAQAMLEGGSSEEAASGTVPDQLQSGQAIIEYRAEIAARLSQQNAQYENMYEACGAILAELCPRVYKSKKARVRIKGRGGVKGDYYEEIDWASIALGEKSFRVTFRAASNLPDSIPGRLQTFDAMGKAGVGIDGLDILANLHDPDIEPIQDRLLAERNMLEKMISGALDDDELIRPLEGMDPARGFQQTSLAYMDAVYKGIYPKSNLEKLRRIMRVFKARMPKPAAPPLASPVAASPTDLPAVAPLAQAQ